MFRRPTAPRDRRQRDDAEPQCQSSHCPSRSSLDHSATERESSEYGRWWLGNHRWDSGPPVLIATSRLLELCRPGPRLSATRRTSLERSWLARLAMLKAVTRRGLTLALHPNALTSSISPRCQNVQIAVSGERVRAAGPGRYADCSIILSSGPVGFQCIEQRASTRCGLQKRTQGESVNRSPTGQQLAISNSCLFAYSA